MKSVRYLSILLILCTLALLLFGCSKSDLPDGMVEASDPKYVDYHLYVPRNWTVDLQTGAVSAYYSKEDPSSVNMMVWDVPSTDYSPDDWWESGQKDLSSVYTNVTLVSSSQTTLGGAQAKQYEWTGTIGVNTYHVLQVACVRNSMVYVFTYSSLAATTNTEGTQVTSTSFETHMEDVQNILQHFSFR